MPSSSLANMLGLYASGERRSYRQNDVRVQVSAVSSRAIDRLRAAAVWRVRPVVGSTRRRGRRDAQLSIDPRRKSARQIGRQHGAFLRLLGVAVHDLTAAIGGIMKLSIVVADRYGEGRARVEREMDAGAADGAVIGVVECVDATRVVAGAGERIVPGTEGAEYAPVHVTRPVAPGAR